MFYNIRSSSAADFGQKSITGNNIAGQHDPGSYVVYHSNPHRYLTSSKGSHHRLEQGTNGTIHVYDDHLDPSKRDPNEENNQDCQAPIRPFSGSRPEGYKSHESSVLLGNMQTGRKSNMYYKYATYQISTSSIYIP